MAEQQPMTGPLGREEIALILDGLRVLRNCRNFAFRDEQGAGDGARIASIDALSQRLRASLDVK